MFNMLHPDFFFLMKFSKNIFSIHSWLGLVSGVFILVFFITGAIIVFGVELNRWERPDLFKVSPQGLIYRSYNTLYRQALQQRPEYYIYSLRYIPQESDETIEMRIYDPKRKEYGLLYQNPYNGQILGESFSSTLYDVLLKLHYTFYLGRIGELLAGVFALALLGSILTGTIVYRKKIMKVLLFRVKIKRNNWRTISSDLHRVLGVWALVFNTILAFSGFYMMLYAFDLKNQFGTSAGSDQITSPPVTTLNIDSLISLAGASFQSQEFNNLNFPRTNEDPVSVHFSTDQWLFGKYNNYVNFDSRSGIQLKRFRESDLSMWESFEYTLYTLHFGQYGGFFIKVIYSFFGICSAIVSITGYLLWLRRKKKSVSKRPVVTKSTALLRLQP